MTVCLLQTRHTRSQSRSAAPKVPRGWPPSLLGAHRTAAPERVPTLQHSLAPPTGLVERGDAALNEELNAIPGPSDSVPMADPTSAPAPPPLPPAMAPRVQGPVTASESTMTRNTEERDLERISAMVEDLQTRIERLRVVYASRRQQTGSVDGAEDVELAEASGTGVGGSDVEGIHAMAETEDAD